MNLLRSSDAKIRQNATIAVRNLSASNDAAPSIIDEAGLPSLIDLLSSAEGETQSQAAVTLRNLSALGSATCQRIVEEGAIPPLVTLLSGGDGTASVDAKIHALGTLRNLSTTESNCLRLKEAGILVALSNVLSGAFLGSKLSEEYYSIVEQVRNELRKTQERE